jgi:Na+-driven multidrug efflux pump
MIAFSCTIASCIAVAFAVCAEFIPLVYNTEPEIRRLATRLMQITALSMPFDALAHSTYFTLRSGGKMLLTFIFDCGFAWFGNVLFAFTLSRFTSLSFLWIFAIVHMVAIAKAYVGVKLVSKGIWVRNIIGK